MQSTQIQLYQTIPHTCPYIETQFATNVVIDPKLKPSLEQYSALIDMGFRRSGSELYRPACESCQACIPVRIPVRRFTANRSQRRTLKKNNDLDVSIETARYSDEYFSLYERYLNQRHADGGMDNPLPDGFSRFLFCDWSPTRFVCFRKHGELLAVAVVDELLQGFSAVYTFFSPDHPQRGLGNFAVLWQIEQAKRLDYDYLYLGYWIPGHPKMDYKNYYKPLQRYLNEHWEDD